VKKTFRIYFLLADHAHPITEIQRPPITLCDSGMFFL